MRIRFLPLVASICLGTALSATMSAAIASQSDSDSNGGAASRQSDADRERMERRWLDRLQRDDQAALAEVVGFRAPEFVEGARWLDSPAKSIEQSLGRVILIQSIDARTARSQVAAVTRAVEQIEETADLDVFFVHTPEGIDRIERTFAAGNPTFPVLLDSEGVYSDALGVFKRPVAMLVDRQGAVRYAGLNRRGLVEATQSLLAEKFDPGTPAPARPVEEVATTVEFPTFDAPVGSASDRRGEAMPEFTVQSWFKDPPVQPNGRLLVIDFWATWCGPCVAAIPHMNDLQRSLSKDVCVVAISDESSSAFDRGLTRQSLRRSSFAYGVARDSTGALKNWFGVRGIPHVVVASSDGVIRWQGHPNSLDSSVMDPLIKANRALVERANTGPSPGNRWARSTDR